MPQEFPEGLSVKSFGLAVEHQSAVPEADRSEVPHAFSRRVMKYDWVLILLFDVVENARHSLCYSECRASQSEFFQDRPAFRRPAQFRRSLARGNQLGAATLERRPSTHKVNQLRLIGLSSAVA